LLRFLNISDRGFSRGDLLVRAEAVLIATEEKIGMIKRFSEQRAVF
jgi:hypothetical protein